VKHHTATSAALELAADLQRDPIGQTRLLRDALLLMLTIGVLGGAGIGACVVGLIWWFHR
jgi:hypothetical protein